MNALLVVDMLVTWRRCPWISTQTWSSCSVNSLNSLLSRLNSQSGNFLPIAPTAFLSLDNWCFWVFFLHETQEPTQLGPFTKKTPKKTLGQIQTCNQIDRNTPPPHASICGSKTVFMGDIKAEGCIDSSSKLTPRSAFECARLTLFWSQSTTGNYFEERRALSVRFRHRTGGRTNRTRTSGTFALVKKVWNTLSQNVVIWNLHTLAHFCVLGCCRLVMQTQSWQYIQADPNKLYLFSFFFIVVVLFLFFLLHRMPLSEPYLAGSLGIDQPLSQDASLSAGTSARDDMFSDSASSVTLEWNP